MSNQVCIHGHFYQPPRENPWIGGVPVQISAAPFHDWNERIAQECYAVNTEVLNARITNNLSRMSFNIGPTLLSWMQVHASDVYNRVIEADRISQECFDGHGSAIAQCYNHMIMPLADAKDKETQVIWGVEDFSKRFNRQPEGMWLPEAAVDKDTLNFLVEHGIKFIVLAPSQAQCVRGIGQEWEEVDQASLDTTVPYKCLLDQGKSIVVFFYNGYMSNDIAFGALAENADAYFKRIYEEREDGRDGLINCAVDGETYGHHRVGGAKILNQVLERIENNESINLTNYSQFLATHSVKHEVWIKENSSWSCEHGVERWRDDCGCCIDGANGWHQQWRGPLREALDWLRDHLRVIYVTEMASYGDPWDARNQYINCLIGKNTITDSKLQDLMEMQKYAMFMYTSCGWFFDDVARIEGQQILQYAFYAIELADKMCGKNLLEGFLSQLEKITSNCPEIRDGRHLGEENLKEERSY